MNPCLKSVLERIKQRSRKSRQAYLRRMELVEGERSCMDLMPCSNMAHSLASLAREERAGFAANNAKRIGIVTAYNDMLSAHQPFYSFPMQIKKTLAADGISVQVAGAVPAMCDGITQGRSGMELSLLSRDTIAMSTAIALSHQVFDGMIGLGTCDKIVPGMLMGMLSFGYLPAIFLPAGPMSSGPGHKQKQELRQRFATGEASRAELLQMESEVYHGPGTCTFYGTANTNQLLMEFLGLHLPGSSFFEPATAIRQSLTDAGARLLGSIVTEHPKQRSLQYLINEDAILNAMVALLASGGSTNHTLHLPAIAKCAGIQIDWSDFDEISRVTPLLMKVYPNGSADVNAFQKAGGPGFLLRELLELELLSDEVMTVCGKGLDAYLKFPNMNDSQLVWEDLPSSSSDPTVLRLKDKPFAKEGGLRLLSGPKLGRAIVKTSALSEKQKMVQAPARIFHDPAQVSKAFETGQLDQDLVVVLPFQGPCAKGMPELHEVSSLLGIIQDRGFQVALLTDGRLSGASAKVLAAIHLWPEAGVGGGIAKIRDGDLLKIDAIAGQLEILVDDEVWDKREAAVFKKAEVGVGREWFSWMRPVLGQAETGASVFPDFET